MRTITVCTWLLASAWLVACGGSPVASTPVPVSGTPAVSTPAGIAGSLTVTVDPVAVGQTSTFTLHADPVPAHVDILFGDGSQMNLDVYIPTVQHTYRSVGTYPVRAQAVYTAGGNAYATVTANVVDPNPVPVPPTPTPTPSPSPSPTPTKPTLKVDSVTCALTAPQTVKCNARVLENGADWPPTSGMGIFQWKFSDGDVMTTSTPESLEYRYPQPGTYIVTFFVADITTPVPHVSATGTTSIVVF
jgi:hypothetical protein